MRGPIRFLLLYLGTIITRNLFHISFFRPNFAVFNWFFLLFDAPNTPNARKVEKPNIFFKTAVYNRVRVHVGAPV